MANLEDIYSNNFYKTVSQNKGSNLRANRDGLSSDELFLLNCLGSNKPDFGSQYQRVVELATTEDDFERVAREWEAVAEKVVRWQGHLGPKSIEWLRQAHETYVKTQKRTALLFARAGDFDSAETHLRNAHITVRSSQISLDLLVSEKEKEQIIETALQNTPTDYFWKRLKSAAQEGDVEKAKKYASLTIQSLATKGLITIPENPFEKLIIANRKYERFFHAQKEVMDYHRIAYIVAIRKATTDALGFAIKNTSNSRESYKGEIQERHRKVKELFLESIKIFVRKYWYTDAYGYAIRSFNELIDPIFDELMRCSTDKNHWLREICKPKQGREKGRFNGEIIGVERRATESTALVAFSWYQRTFNETQIPIPVEAHYSVVFVRYHGHLPKTSDAKKKQKRKR
jgi:hypothetical protein